MAAPFVPIFGGPKYIVGVGGYVAPGLGPDTSILSSVTSTGAVVTWSTTYDAAVNPRGDRASYFDPSGVPAVELTPFGTYPNGITSSYPNAINSTGAIVGSAYQFDATQRFIGRRAARWDAPSAAPVELGYLGATGSADSEANAINTAGTVVGYATKVGPSATSLGYRPVRWDAGSTTAVELGTLGTDAAGVTSGPAGAINAAGTIVGAVQKYVAGVDRGTRPVRWDASTTVATELDVLGTDAAGGANAVATQLNAAGTIIGSAHRYDSAGADKGERAVRWAAAGTVVTELGVLNTNSAGVTATRAKAINGAGTIVGYANRYDAADHNLGKRAVRWDATGTTAVQLGDLGTGPGGITQAGANDINAAGNIVGYATKYATSGTNLGTRALYWAAGSTTPLDLNSLIDPASGWTLSTALAISDDNNWVTGIGLFDPDGASGQAAYERPYLIQVPEPAATALGFLGGATALLRRRRARRRR